MSGPGGPFDDSRGAATVRDQISAALRGGAVAHIDPKLFAADKEGTPYIAPQVLTSVNHQMTFMNVNGSWKVAGLGIDNELNPAKEAIPTQG